MRKYLIPAVSLAALTMSGMAFAQTTTAPTPEQPAQLQPGAPDCTANPSDPACATTTEVQKTDPDGTVAPSDGTAQKTPPAGTDTGTGTAAGTDPAITTGAAPIATEATGSKSTSTDAAATTTGTAKADTTGPSFLATSFIGKAVYTAAKENVGDINDLLVGEKGNVKAAVIGVGGFLGMGEKDVAVPLDKITMTKDENGMDYLTIAASREELEAAPAFDRTMVTGLLQ